MQTQAIDQVLRQATDAKEVAGVVAAATSDKGIVYEGAAGLRELGKPAAMTVDTVFWIASMTKAVTSVAALQLVERGKLSLDAPLGPLLPELADRQVLLGFDGDKPQLRPARQPITLRRLLTHTAGFAYDIWNPTLGKYVQQAGLPGIITCENKALSTPLMSDPGERWEYGINIDWVGKAVEKASGQRLDAYLRDNILAPLGMRDTGFNVAPAARERQAAMHVRQGDGSLQPIPFGLPEEPEFFMGGGGLYSTARDYLAFLRALLNGGSGDGNRILKAETVAEMGKNQIGALTAGVMKTAAPEFSGDVDLFPGQELKWSLAFLINPKQGPNGRSPGSLTWAGLGNTYFWIDPVKKLGGVILTQSLPFVDPKAVALYGRFEQSLYRAL